MLGLKYARLVVESSCWICECTPCLLDFADTSCKQIPDGAHYFVWSISSALGDSAEMRLSQNDIIHSVDNLSMHNTFPSFL
jgi:hypothetical protein